MTERFITAEDVALPLGLTPRCIRKWAAKGDIPGAYRLNGAWRFDPIKVRNWVRQQEQKGHKWVSTSAVTFGGFASNSGAKKSASLLEQRLNPRPRTTRSADATS